MITILLALLSLSKQFKLKHAGKESYVCDGSEKTKRPLMTCPSKESATDFKIAQKPKGTGLFSPSNDPFVWDVAEAWRVEIKVKHEKPNQLFALSYVSPDKFAILNREKCLTWEDPYHRMRDCNFQDNQLYTIIYNEEESKQVGPENKATSSLSSSPIDNIVLERLERMIEENKQIAKHIAHSHNMNRRHHHHHHKISHKRRKEEGPYLLDYPNN